MANPYICSVMTSFRAIFSVMFALLVLASSSNFSVGLHHCGGAVRDVAFLEHADGCGHQQLPPCHRKMMQDCCKDELIVHQGQGFHHESAKIHTAPSFIDHVTIPPILVAEIIPSFDRTPVRFFNYDVPLRSPDRIVIHQVFLI